MDLVINLNRQATSQQSYMSSSVLPPSSFPSTFLNLIIIILLSSGSFHLQHIKQQSPRHGPRTRKPTSGARIERWEIICRCRTRKRIYRSLQHGRTPSMPSGGLYMHTGWRSKAEQTVPRKFITVSHTTNLKTDWNAHCIPAHTMYALDVRFSLPEQHALLLALLLPRRCRPQAFLIDCNGVCAEPPPPTAVRRHLDGTVYRVQRKPNPRAVRDPRPYRSKRVSSTMTTLRLPSRSSGRRPRAGFDVERRRRSRYPAGENVRLTLCAQRGPAQRHDRRGRRHRPLVLGQRGDDHLGAELPLWGHAAHLERRRALRVRVP